MPRLWSGFVGAGLLAVAVVVAGLSPAGHAREAKKGGKTVVEIAAADKDFSKLVAAVKAAGLAEALSGEGPFTVFAPTDKAFEALGEETLKAVLADKAKLKAILTYHVVKGRVPANEATVLAKFERSVPAVNGAEIRLSLKGKDLTLDGGSTVVKADIEASNGLIHVIDKVLLPPAGKAVAKKGKRRELCPPVGEALLYSRVIRGAEATQADKDRLVKLFKEASEATPPKGDKAEWKKRHEKIIEAAEGLAAEDDPMKFRREQTRLNLATNCIGCHNAQAVAVRWGGLRRLRRLPEGGHAQDRFPEVPEDRLPESPGEG